MPPRRPSTAAAASLFQLLLLGSPPAQDMVAVGWDGRIHAFDSRSGRHDLLAVTAMGQNALARDATGQLWSTARLPAGAGHSFHLTRIDATAGSASIAFPSVDLRGLAAAPTDSTASRRSPAARARGCGTSTRRAARMCCSAASA